MLPETVARLAPVPNIIGTKEAKGDLDRIRQLISLCGPKFAVYSGDDASACEAILNGAQGNISVTANVAPAQMHAMCAAAAAGNRDEALAIDAPLQVLHEKLFLESNPIPVKFALRAMGKIPEGIRLPLTWLDKSYHHEVRSALAEAKVL